MFTNVEISWKSIPKVHLGDCLDGGKIDPRFHSFGYFSLSLKIFEDHSFTYFLIADKNLKNGSISPQLLGICFYCDGVLVLNNIFLKEKQNNGWRGEGPPMGRPLINMSCQDSLGIKFRIEQEPYPWSVKYTEKITLSRKTYYT